MLYYIYVILYISINKGTLNGWNDLCATISKTSPPSHRCAPKMQCSRPVKSFRFGSASIALSKVSIGIPYG